MHVIVVYRCIDYLYEGIVLNRSCHARVRLSRSKNENGHGCKPIEGHNSSALFLTLLSLSAVIEVSLFTVDELDIVSKIVVVFA